MLPELLFEAEEDFPRLGTYNIITFGTYHWVLKNEAARKILPDILFRPGNFPKYITTSKIRIMIVYEIMTKTWASL